ncbi:MAG: MaoC family dehydratase N-terminal domain-containing protein [Candidatus Bathyarchaeota archaeon]
MSDHEVPDWSKVKPLYTPQMIANGIPPPEKWKGLELARSIGSKGYTFDTLVEDARKMIGFEVWEGGPSLRLGAVNEFSSYICREDVLSHGDDNPLYTDMDYGKKTKYGCMLTYPTFLHRVRYGMTHGVNNWGPYPTSTLVAGLSWEYYDVVRVNSRFRSSMKMKDVVEKKGATGRLALYLTDTSFWDQRDSLIAGGGGTYICVGKSGEEAKKAEEATKRGAGMSESMLYERKTHHYSDEDVKKIVDGVKGEQRRGATPRYWEDVNVGDKLTPTVKGPFRIQEVTKGHGWDHSPANVNFKPTMGARLTANPLTGWPYESGVVQHWDFNLCNIRGLPGPFDHGIQRMTLAAHVLSNWMGDDGFIRRTSSQVRKPCYYGDTQWYKGEVVNKYKDKAGGIEYGAVDIVVTVENQVGENTLPSKATIYLPSRELGEVKLPIPPPSQEEWKLVTQRDVKGFFKEIQSGETIFPPLPQFVGREEE